MVEKNKTYIGLILTIAIVILVSSVMLNAKSIEPSFVDGHDQIVYDGKTVTDIPGDKYLPILSPDGKRIAFLYRGNAENGFINKIGIIDNKSGVTEDMIIENSHATSYSEILWLDNERVGIIGHVNPSLQELYMINISSKIHDAYHGIGFTIDQSTGNVVFILPQSHFGEDEQGKNKIVDSGGNIYYESPSHVTIVGGPHFDDAGTRVAFFEYDMIGDATQLVVADRSAHHPFVNIKKQRWEDALGRIQWKSQTLIEIETESPHQIFEVDLSDRTVDD